MEAGLAVDANSSYQDIMDQLQDISALQENNAELLKGQRRNLEQREGDLQKALGERLEALQTVPEHLRDDQITSTLAAEPDTYQAEKLLREYLSSVAQRVLPSKMRLGPMSVSVRLVGRNTRIMPNDFLEKKNEKSQPPSLCRCSTERSEAGRLKVSEWDGSEWGTLHVIYNNYASDYRVVTEERARQLAPEAFGDSGLDAEDIA